MLKRIQRKYFQKLPPKTKSITRPGKWGNPFRIVSENNKFWVKDKEGNYWGEANEGYRTKGAAAKKAVECYRGYLRAMIKNKKLNLSDFDAVQNIACFCKTDETCHGDVIIEFVEFFLLRG